MIYYNVYYDDITNFFLNFNLNYFLFVFCSLLISLEFYYFRVLFLLLLLLPKIKLIIIFYFRFKLAMSEKNTHTNRLILRQKKLKTVAFGKLIILIISVFNWNIYLNNVLNIPVSKRKKYVNVKYKIIYCMK